LGAPATCHEESPAPELQQIDWRGLSSPSLTPADLKQVVVRQAESQAEQKSEDLVQGTLKWIRSTKRGEIGVHVSATKQLTLPVVSICETPRGSAEP